MIVQSHEGLAQTSHDDRIDREDNESLPRLMHNLDQGAGWAPMKQRQRQHLCLRIGGLARATIAMSDDY
jgi:hypothetical protein